MKKNVKKKTTKTTRKISWLQCVIAFVLGALLGIIVYANIDSLSFGTDLKCLDGTTPDSNGCCAGEIYTDMGDLGFNCCPQTGGDCFPPIR